MANHIRSSFLRRARVAFRLRCRTKPAFVTAWHRRLQPAALTIRRALRSTIAFTLLWFGAVAFGEQRFPPPDFESGHQLPATATPPARAWAMEYVDVAVLAGCLALATWLVWRRRSRRGLMALSIFSLLYFGLRHWLGPKHRPRTG
jgi:hypothetical protein